MDIIDLKPAVEMIKEFEGLVLTAYQDGGGIWTIGYGHTAGVHQGMVITEEQAETLLADDLNEDLLAIEHYVYAPMSNNEACAFLSFSYNVGWPSFVNSTLLRMFNAGDPKIQVADQFLRWVHDVNDKIEPGLVRRRQAERELFLKP